MQLFCDCAMWTGYSDSVASFEKLPAWFLRYLGQEGISWVIRSINSAANTDFVSWNSVYKCASWPPFHKTLLYIEGDLLATTCYYYILLHVPSSELFLCLYFLEVPCMHESQLCFAPLLSCGWAIKVGWLVLVAVDLIKWTPLKEKGDVLFLGAREEWGISQQED